MATETGYAVTIRGFLRTERSDLDAMQKAVEALKGAESGEDYNALLGLMKVEELSFKPVTRRGKDEPA